MSRDEKLSTTTSISALRRSVARQVLRIAALADQDCSTRDAEDTLSVLVSSLALVEICHGDLRAMKRRARIA